MDKEKQLKPSSSQRATGSNKHFVHQYSRCLVKGVLSGNWSGEKDYLGEVMKGVDNWCRKSSAQTSAQKAL